jgi:hypothetical protein
MFCQRRTEVLTLAHASSRASFELLRGTALSNGILRCRAGSPYGPMLAQVTKKCQFGHRIMEWILLRR